MNLTNGFDVSRWQGEINWPDIPDKYKFVVIRYSVGNYYADPQRHVYYAGAKGEEILVGGYMVNRPDINPDSQVEKFISSIEEDRLDFVVLDCELAMGKTVSEIRANIKACLERLKYYFKVPIFVYASPGWWNQWVGEVDWLTDIECMVAHWYYPDVQTPTKPMGFRRWVLWQYTNKGTIPGVPSGVDKDFARDVFFTIVAPVGPEKHKVTIVYPAEFVEIDLEEA